MTGLEKISKHIFENRLSFSEIHFILKSYYEKEIHKAWIRGWLRRSGLSNASRRAHKTSVRKCAQINEEFEDYLGLDLSRPLAPDTLVDIKGDYKEVKYVTIGDEILFKGEYKKVLEVKCKDKKILLKI